MIGEIFAYMVGRSVGRRQGRRQVLADRDQDATAFLLWRAAMAFGIVIMVVVIIVCAIWA